MIPDPKTRLRSARRGAALFFLLYALAVTWPGMLLGNRIEPLVFGLPFSMVWVALWVVGGGVVLLMLDRVEQRHARSGKGGAAGGDPVDGPN